MLNNKKHGIFKRAILFSSVAMFVCFSMLAGQGHCFWGTSKKAQPRTIAIISQSDFLTKIDQPVHGAAIPDEIAEKLSEYLTVSKRFRVVERSELRRLVLEKRVGSGVRKGYMDGALSKFIKSFDGEATIGGWLHGESIGRMAAQKDQMDDLRDLGNSAGADYIVLGTVEKISVKTKSSAVPYSTRKAGKKTTKAKFRVRLVDVANSVIMGAINNDILVEESFFQGGVSSPEQQNALHEICRDAAGRIIDLVFPPTIQVKEGQYILTRGSNEGVSEGNIYSIMRPGTEITDGSAGVIGRLNTPVGKAEVVQVQSTLSVVKNVEGGGFQDGDLAMRAEKKEAASKPSKPVNPAEKSSARGDIPTLAVGQIKFVGTDIPQGCTVTGFTDELITKLQSTKRFQLVERQLVDQLLNEQDFDALSKNQGLSSAVGTLQGVDYLVYGNIAFFNIEEKKVNLNTSVKIPSMYRGQISGTIRIVDVRTGNIISSRTINIDEALKSGISPDGRIQVMKEGYARKVTQELMSAVFPMMVAAVGSDGTVYINCGSNRGLSVGDTMEVFSAGEEIRDPQTGVVLGVQEVQKGSLVLTEVNEALSKARMINGSGVARGAIVKSRSTGSGSKKGNRALSSASTGYSGKTLKASTGPLKYQIVVGKIDISGAYKCQKSTLQKLLFDDLTVRLQNTGRFTVLERRELDQILEQMSFDQAIHSSDFQDMLAGIKEADYLLTGEIRSYEGSTKMVKQEYLDEVTEVVTKGKSQVLVRILDIRTGAVVAADKFMIGSEAETTTYFFDKFSEKVTSHVLMRLFPIKVLGVGQNGTVYINRGEDGKLKPGQTFDVFSPGEALRDPDTGLVFGNEEEKVGSVRIKSVESSRSKAVIISGMGLRKGDILRPVQVSHKQVKRKKQNETAISW